MAGPDLGTPRNRETPFTASPESVDVLGGLTDIGAGVKAGITEAVVRNTREEMEQVPEDVAQESATALARAEEVPGAGQELTGDPAIDAVKGKIGRLQAIVGATSGSARARAELELRRVVNDASARFPGLRTRLAQEMNLFEATDPEYQTLAMLDTQMALENEQAAAELDEIRDFAYARAPDGLGLSPGLHRMESKEFAAHVAYKGALVEEAQTRLLVLNDANTASQIDAESKAEAAVNFFKGKGAPYREAISAAASLAWEAAEAARNITTPGASAQLLAWEQGGKQQVYAELQAVRADTVAQMSKLFSSRELAVSETAKQAQAQLEAELAALDQVMEALSGEETNWGVIKAYEAYNTARQAEFDARFPAEANARLVIGNMLPFIEAADGAFGNVDALAKNRVANYSLHTMNTMGKFLGITDIMSGAGLAGLIGEETADDILDTLSGIRDDNFMTLTNGIQSNMAGQSQAHLWGQIAKQFAGEKVSPEIANKLTLAHASSFVGVGRGPVYEDLTRDHMLTLADPSVLVRAAQARQYGNPGAGPALGKAAKEADLQFYKVREAQWQTALSANLGGAAASELIVVDLDNLAKGKIQFVVDDEKLAVMAQTADPLSGVGASRLRQRAMDQAIKMTKQFSEDLSYLANMDALIAGSDEPNYVDAYRRHGFTDYLPDLEDNE